ncbi:MAG TPA: TonB-dependent receptor [Thermoanaerobaculia bacterium]|nr:TonB-dependent receptor [Thermoanaerobaculia bacterium]
MPNARKILAAGFIALSLAAGALQAQESRDLSALSVDDLMNVEVTSVSRKAQKLSDTAAAVFVITQDDIRESGATSIPEVLRIVPGLDVARISGNTWAISARGSNGQYANKLLVMIDGRTVYTPLFAGVFWDVQDTLLDDVDRIEVIRGPGGTLWGANAVNGIINIITKSAIETQGTLVAGGGGAAEGSSAAVRHGGSLGKNGNYRVYGKTFDRPASTRAIHDDWTLGHGGFRADWASRGGDNFTIQGDAYRGTSAADSGGFIDPANPFDVRPRPTKISGDDLLFRWTAVQSSRSDTTVQAFVDDTARTNASLDIRRRTVDIDFNHHLRIGRSDSVWGAEFRRSVDRAVGPGLALVRDSNIAATASAFVQDEIRVTRALRVIAGTKVQYDSVSHLQFQPTLRILYKVNERQTLWAAATSAVRTPSETELYGQIDVGAFPDGRGNAALIVVNGNRALEPERVDSYEVGYRRQISNNIDFDVTAFRNRIRDLTATAAPVPFVDATGRLIVPLNIVNSMDGSSYGEEFLLTDALAPNWNVALGYSFLHIVTMDDAGVRSAAITDPRHQLQLRSNLQLSRGLSIDTAAFYVGAIGNKVPAYLRLDAQLSWHPASRWELSISGQNLLRAQHPEFAGADGQGTTAIPIQRTVNGKITWRF